MIGVTRTIRARSFGEVANDYDRLRPSYPEGAVDWLAPPAPARVADVGAGTGKLSSLLLARGLTVESVEPDERMLAVLARNNPEANLHVSDSARIPVEDASLDAVLVAEAWHWFDKEQTFAELRRVLKPGGWLGVVWNVVAVPVAPWEFELSGPSDDFDRATKGNDAGVGANFLDLSSGEVEYAQFPWEQEITPARHAANLATSSMVLALTPEERQEATARARSKFQTVCDSLGRDSLRVRYEASCARWVPKRSTSESVSRR